MADRLTGTVSGVTTRPATQADRQFLLEVYASSRQAELALVQWSAEQKQAFVEQQFHAQDTSYRAAYGAGGEFLVVELDGQPIGRLILARFDTELRVADIALLPEYRGRGIGTQLIHDVLERARSEGIPVTLHVESWNPAKRLYERLGFVFVEQRGINEFMRAS